MSVRVWTILLTALLVMTSGPGSRLLAGGCCGETGSDKHGQMMTEVACCCDQVEVPSDDDSRDLDQRSDQGPRDSHHGDGCDCARPCCSGGVASAIRPTISETMFDRPGSCGMPRGQRMDARDFALGLLRPPRV